MPRLDYVRRSSIARTPRVAQVEGMFDIEAADGTERSWTADLPIEDRDWNIGLIVGPSGSGKSTLLAEAFGQPRAHDWPAGSAVVDGFPASMGIHDVTGVLGAVGFSSPPSWLRPYATLSTGEQFRVDVARVLAETGEGDVAVVDEFTSVVDRTVAQIGAAAVGKHVRRTGAKLVAASCHYDIIEWLGPDWVYDAGAGTFTWGSLHRRPPIVLELARASRSWWSVFHHHHYLSGSLAKGSTCFVAFVGDRPAAFVAVAVMPSPKGYVIKREHRVVCLPDFQGVGIGNAVAELVASLYRSRGMRYRSTTSHPAMIAHRARSPLWKMDRKPSFIPKPTASAGYTPGSRRRLTASFEYVGKKAEPEQAQLLDLSQSEIESSGSVWLDQHGDDSSPERVSVGVPVSQSVGVGEV